MSLINDKAYPEAELEKSRRVRRCLYEAVGTKALLI